MAKVTMTNHFCTRGRANQSLKLSFGLLLFAVMD